MSFGGDGPGRRLLWSQVVPVGRRSSPVGRRSSPVGRRSSPVGNSGKVSSLRQLQPQITETTGRPRASHRDFLNYQRRWRRSLEIGAASRHSLIAEADPSTRGGWLQSLAMQEISLRSAVSAARTSETFVRKAPQPPKSPELPTGGRPEGVGGRPEGVGGRPEGVGGRPEKGRRLGKASPAVPTGEGPEAGRSRPCRTSRPSAADRVQLVDRVGG